QLRMAANGWRQLVEHLCHMRTREEVFKVMRHWAANLHGPTRIDAGDHIAVSIANDSVRCVEPMIEGLLQCCDRRALLPLAIDVGVWTRRFQAYASSGESQVHS